MGEAILEFQRVGRAVKVTAIDPTTLVEVSLAGPAEAGREALSRAAVRKLDWVLARRAGKPEGRRDGRPSTTLV